VLGIADYKQLKVAIAWILLVFMNRATKLEVFRFGSCRVFNLPDFRWSTLDFCNQPLGYTHGTKEVIQLIRMLRGELDIPKDLYPYAFSFYSGKDRLPAFEKAWKENARALQACDVVVIEISSCKIMHYRGAYLQYVLCTRPEIQGITPMGGEALAAVRRSKQTADEILADLHAIARLLIGKRLIFTPHINASVADEPVIPDRDLLSHCLSAFCKENDHLYYSAWDVLAQGDRKYVCEDLTHLTPAGGVLVRRAIADLLRGNKVSGRCRARAEQVTEQVIGALHRWKQQVFTTAKFLSHSAPD
jgi:hypothetical protein